jgi:hypothetical protein
MRELRVYGFSILMSTLLLVGCHATKKESRVLWRIRTHDELRQEVSPCIGKGMGDVVRRLGKPDQVLNVNGYDIFQYRVPSSAIPGAKVGDDLFPTVPFGIYFKEGIAVKWDEI